MFGRVTARHSHDTSFGRLQPHPRPDRIDKKIIDGHVISEQVVFTGSAPTEEPFETLAFDDNIKVTISFFTQGEGANMKSECPNDDACDNFCDANADDNER